MDMCAICHEPFDGKTPIVIAKHSADRSLEESRKRGHYFHRSCLEQWKKHCCLRYDTHDLPVGFICPMDRDEIGRLYTVPNYELVKFDLKYYDSDMLKVMNECRLNKHFLQQIIDIDETDKRNKTLAYYACYLGDLVDTRTPKPAACEFNPCCLQYIGATLLWVASIRFGRTFFHRTVFLDIRRGWPLF